MGDAAAFHPALIVVDMQEDFCAPNGSLAVPGGRELAPIINELLGLPFTLKIATKDFHPPNHASFDISHPSPNNKAFESTATMTNPYDPSESKHSTLWPVHCVQGTPGANIIPEVDVSKIQVIVEKGRDSRVEMYSGFADMFGNKSDAASLDLAALLRENSITHVYVVGLTGDCCVRYTALDAWKEGLETFVVKQGIRSVDEGEAGWGAAENELRRYWVSIVDLDGPEVAMVRHRS